MIHLLLAAAIAVAAAFGAAGHATSGHPSFTTMDCTGNQCDDIYSGGGPVG